MIVKIKHCTYSCMNTGYLQDFNIHLRLFEDIFKVINLYCMGGVGQCMVTLILKCKMTVKNYD